MSSLFFRKNIQTENVVVQENKILSIKASCLNKYNKKKQQKKTNKYKYQYPPLSPSLNIAIKYKYIVVNSHYQHYYQIRNIIFAPFNCYLVSHSFMKYYFWHIRNYFCIYIIVDVFSQVQTSA